MSTSSIIPPELQNSSFEVKSKEQTYLVKRQYDKLAEHLIQKSNINIIVTIALIILVGAGIVSLFAAYDTVAWITLAAYVIGIIVVFAQIREKLALKQAANELLERIRSEQGEAES